MNNDPRSHGLWEQTAPPPPATSALPGRLDADVAVVGAGFTGLSAALHLAAAGLRVVVLEGSEIGFGGSGRNVGLVNAGLWIMPDDLRSALGETYGERLLSLLGSAPEVVFQLIAQHGVDCEAVHAGTLHLAADAAGVAELRQRAAQWQARGAPVELLDAAATAIHVGSAAYAGALLDRRAGTIQPLAYVRGLATAAIAAGANIFTHSPVVAAVQDGTAWRISTPDGSVSAPHVVVATNAYSVGPWSAVRSEITVLPYFNVATPPLPASVLKTVLPERQGCWDTKAILSSFRLDRAGRLVFGSVGAWRGTGVGVHRAWAKRALRRLFPQIAPTEFESAWYGRIGMTDDALPRLHMFSDKVIGISGYNGRGIGPGTVFGRTLAQHILGELTDGDLPLPLTDSRPARARVLREAYYEIGAQVAHIATERF